MRRQIAFAVLLSSMCALQVAAQSTEAQPGARVRVTAPGIVAGRYEGTILARSADTIIVGGPNMVPIHVAVSRISSLEISRGKSRSDGAITGMKWGVPIMAATGLTLGIAASAADCRSCDPVDAGDVVYVTVVFGLAGAIYGAGIGALIGRERWDAFDLSPRTTLRLQQHGRLGVGLELSF